jgi:hypothetical protein
MPVRVYPDYSVDGFFLRRAFLLHVRVQRVYEYERILSMLSTYLIALVSLAAFFVGSKALLF